MSSKLGSDDPEREEAPNPGAFSFSFPSSVYHSLKASILASQDPYESRNPDTASWYETHGYLTDKEQANRLLRDSKTRQDSAG